MYLLSNTIFKKKAMVKVINKFNLEKYFTNLYFSADYGVRKPHKKFFQLVYDDIIQKDITIEKKQVYFVGDNFEADVLGAKSFGFTPVFINRKKEKYVNQNDFIEISALNELIELIV